MSNQQTKSSTNPVSKSWVEQAETTKISKQENSLEKKEFISIIVFQVEGDSYGVPISDVREIVPVPHITPLPQSPAHMLGVCNIRGTVIAVIDATKRMQNKSYGTAEGFVLMLKNEEIKAGLLVRQVPKTITIDIQLINRSSAVLQSLDTKDQYITGLFKHEDQMIQMVDLLSLIG